MANLKAKRTKSPVSESKVRRGELGKSGDSRDRWLLVRLSRIERVRGVDDSILCLRLKFQILVCYLEELIRHITFCIAMKSRMVILVNLITND